MKKFAVLDLKKDWNNIFKIMKKKNLKISDIEISKQVKAHRKKISTRIVMNSEMVLDTNVMTSAIINSGTSRKLYKK